MASVVLVVLRHRVPVDLVAQVAPVVRVPLVGLAHAWVVCLPTRSVVVQWVLVALVVQVARALQVAQVAPAHLVVRSVVLVVPVVVLGVAREPALVVPAVPVAVAAPAVSVVAQRRSRVHGGVKSSTSFSQLLRRPTRRVRRRFRKESSSSSEVALRRSLHRN